MKTLYYNVMHVNKKKSIFVSQNKIRTWPTLYQRWRIKIKKNLKTLTKSSQEIYRNNFITSIGQVVQKFQITTNAQKNNYMLIKIYSMTLYYNSDSEAAASKTMSEYTVIIINNIVRRKQLKLKAIDNAISIG